MTSVKSPRPYRSPRREAQAAATRAAVLEAARETFLELGYVAATITTIAERTGVSPETVYSIFRTKGTLLKSVIDVSIGGDDTPVPLLDRPWVRTMRDESDPRRRVRILATNGRMILERITPIYDVLTAAAAADRELAGLLERYRQERFAGQHELAGIVVRGAEPPARMSHAAAADLLFTLGSPETYRLLTGDRGWSAARFERWYVQTLERLLFA